MTLFIIMTCEREVTHIISTLLLILCIRRTHFVIRYNNIAVSPLSNCSCGHHHHLARQSFLRRVIYARRDVTLTKKKITTYERQSVVCTMYIIAYIVYSIHNYVVASYILLLLIS